MDLEYIRFFLTSSKVVCKYRCCYLDIYDLTHKIQAKNQALQIFVTNTPCFELMLYFNFKY